MKRIFSIGTFALVALAGGQFSVRGALAPADFNKSVAFLSGALTQFMSDSHSFSATTDLTVQQAGASDSRVRLRFGSAFDAGKMRFDLNLKDQVNAALGTGLPHLGIDRLMFMMYPSHPARVVFPSEQSYFEVPLDQAATPEIKDQAVLASSRLQKKLVGSDNISGVQAKKYQLHADGSQQTAHLWEADSLNGLPVMLRVQTGGTIYNFAFSNIRKGPLDPRVFGIPASFKKRSGVQEVIQLNGAKIVEQLNAALPR
ncbi:MAG: hypothetical protein ACPGVU_04585 [Limisphaerales bacterium]